MKIVGSFFLVLGGLAANAQPAGTHLQLKGYFLVDCDSETLKSGCTLDIASVKAVDGDSMTCGDGAFYKNISGIRYIAPNALNLREVDDFTYRIKLQGQEHRVYLSTNPLILRDAGPTAAVLRRNPNAVRAIKQNRVTADLLQHQVDSLQLDFGKKRHCTVLMYGTISALVLPDRQTPKTYKTPLGYHQYLLLEDKTNKMRFARLLKAPF